MKILQIHDYPPLEGGGIEIVTSHLAEELVKSGHQVTIATGRFASETYIEKDRGTEFVSENGTRIILVQSLIQLQSLIQEHEVIHVHFTFSCRPTSMFGMEEAIKYKKKVFVSIETSPEHIPFSSLGKLTELERDSKLEQVKRLFSNNMVTLLSPSSHIEKALREMKIKKSVEIVRNGIQIPTDVKRNKHESVDVTYIGELSVLKGVNYLIDAVRELKKVMPNLKVRFIGNGSDFSQMYQLIWHFGLQDTIRLTGYVKNIEIPEYLKSTRLLVHPSLTEVWPGSVAEALSMGIPAIVTDVGGLPEMVGNGEYASIVPKANAHILANEIKRILCNNEEYLIMQQKAKRASDYFVSHYTFQQQAQQLLKLYSK